ncbi:hypothetical protein A5893_10370 [Pedobacter psychrophilus]|uniref:TonB-dependent receptor plug domain-containing protein n=1 Tax=Pedobacter psychrophilus TaxID=1826909 RepID=A0A179DDG1_9SPHI|nr:carboxypeptidase-like regulatory domain-containing protein [Pedobacter psychrophilus]OAQ39071.1 hypothetical protein A5893_10370 [Pedobacter psychrophilus]
MKKLLQSFFVMLLIATSVLAQDKTVTGTVTDQTDGSPLPGVSVTIVGTKLGTQTDVNGKYSLRAPSGSTKLIFSFIGYTNKTVTINGTTLNVTLDSDNKQLSEVVVVGYGTQLRKDVTGSSSTFKRV